jgi:hypothetical protein
MTLLLGIIVAGMLLYQIHYTREENRDLSLVTLCRRIPELKVADEPIARDMICVPLAADMRALDTILQPDARVFLTGMIGKSNGSSLGYYYFMRNYLYPRDVEISLGGQAVFRDGWFEGVPCESTNILKAAGFDDMIGYTNNQMMLIPLTPKGAPHPQ